MRTIVVLGQKGGSGKTMLAQSIAVAALRDGIEVGLLDTDPQQSAARWSLRQPERAGLWVSSSPVERAGKVAAGLREGGKLGLLVVDAPGRAGPDSIDIARLANLVLVPVHPTGVHLETLPVIQEILKRAGGPPHLVVINDAPTRGARHEEARAVLAPAWKVWPGTLFHRQAHADAMDFGQTAQERQPGGKAALEIGDVYTYICRHYDIAKVSHTDGKTRQRRARAAAHA